MTASVCLSLCALLPLSAGAQALTSLASVRVGYTSRKNTVKPEGELKAQIDALDAQIAEASRLGKNGELRRLFAKGMALLGAGDPWTEAYDYSRSLVLRSPRVVVDSAKPYEVRLEQIYAPSLALQNTLTAHVALPSGSRRRRRRASGPPIHRWSRISAPSTACRAICASRRSSSISICATCRTARTTSASRS